MSQRTVTVEGGHKQKPYGDHAYRYEIDFHYGEVDFGGAPSAEYVLDIARAMVPALKYVRDLKVEPSANATHNVPAYSGGRQADRWIVTGKRGYRG